MAKNKSWDDNYSELKKTLQEKGVEAVSLASNAWIKYQKQRIGRLNRERIRMLDELNPLLGYDWRASKPGKVKKPQKRRKRKSIIGFGQRVIDARIAIGFNDRKEFAVRINTAVTTLRDWEDDISIPTADRVLILCEALGVSSDWLIFGIEDDKRTLKDKTLFELFRKAEHLPAKELYIFKKIVKEFVVAASSKK